MAQYLAASAKMQEQLASEQAAQQKRMAEAQALHQQQMFQLLFSILPTVSPSLLDKPPILRSVNGVTDLAVESNSALVKKGEDIVADYMKQAQSELIDDQLLRVLNQQKNGQQNMTHSPGNNPPPPLPLKETSYYKSEPAKDNNTEITEVVLVDEGDLMIGECYLLSSTAAPPSAELCPTCSFAPTYSLCSSIWSNLTGISLLYLTATYTSTIKAFASSLAAIQSPACPHTSNTILRTPEATPSLLAAPGIFSPPNGTIFGHKASFPVHTAPAGSDQFWTYPQVSYTSLALPTSVSPLPGASSNFSLPKTPYLGHFSYKNSSSADLGSNGRFIQALQPQGTPQAHSCSDGTSVGVSMTESVISAENRPIFNLSIEHQPNQVNSLVQSSPQSINISQMISELVSPSPVVLNNFSHIETSSSAINSGFSANSDTELVKQLHQQQNRDFCLPSSSERNTKSNKQAISTANASNRDQTANDTVHNQNTTKNHHSKEIKHTPHAPIVQHTPHIKESEQTPTPEHHKQGSKPIETSSMQSSSTKQHCSTGETVVPCSLYPKNQNNPAKSQIHSSSFYKQKTPTPSTNRSLPIPSNSFKNKHRFHNQYDPISDLHWEGDGEGENWDILGSSDDDFDNDHNDDMLHEGYPGIGRNQETAYAATNLSFSDAIDWGNMAEDEPLPSWEACADANFKDALKGKSHNCCLLKQDSSSSILNQTFPPLQNPLAPPSNSPPSTISRPIHLQHPSTTTTSTAKSSSSSGGSEFAPGTKPKHPKATTSLLHKQKKLSKAAKREANALARLSKPSTAIPNQDPDQYQWNLLLADQAKRAEKAASSKETVKPINEVTHVNEGWKEKGGAALHKCSANSAETGSLGQFHPHSNAQQLHQAQVISGLQTSPHPNNINQISSAHDPTLNDAQNKIPHLETPHLALKSCSSTTSEASLVLGVSKPFQPLPHATNIYMSTLEVAPSVVIAHNNFHPHETSFLGQKIVINTALVDDNVSMSDLHFQDYP
ncbi:hypothetical protein LguiB_008608 [Lonicera macranthoides]